MQLIDAKLAISGEDHRTAFFSPKRWLLSIPVVALVGQLHSVQCPNHGTSGLPITSIDVYFLFHFKAPGDSILTR